MCRKVEYSSVTLGRQDLEGLAIVPTEVPFRVKIILSNVYPLSGCQKDETKEKHTRRDRRLTPYTQRSRPPTRTLLLDFSYEYLARRRREEEGGYGSAGDSMGVGRKLGGKLIVAFALLQVSALVLADGVVALPFSK